MPESTPPPAASPAPPRPPRFSWPMRVFVFLLVFEIVFRSLSILLPWKDWEDDLGMDRFPRRLPTRAEMMKLGAAASPEDPHPVADRLGETLVSVGEFLKPWPSEKVREKSDSSNDLGKYVVVWLNRRMSFCENLVGIEERWEMFSPGASRGKDLTRVRLTFADDTECVVHQNTDPDDLSGPYFRWNMEKILDHEMQARDDSRYEDECFGYCNLLANRYPYNTNGARLKKIRLFRIHYDYPPPGQIGWGLGWWGGVPYPWVQYVPPAEDPRDFIRRQQGPPDDQVFPDFYEFDAADWSGRRIKK